MFRVNCLKPARFARNFNSRNLSSINKGKPESASISPKLASAPQPASNALVIAVTLAAASSIALVLNADNKDLVALLDKRAPFLNTILKPFRKPVSFVSIAKEEKSPVVIELAPEVVEIVEEQTHNETTNSNEVSVNEPPVELTVSSDLDDNQPIQSTPLEVVSEPAVEEEPVSSPHAITHEAFSAHDEVHDLEVKYEADLYAVSQQHADTPDNKPATTSYPMEVNSALLHHELQTQAKAILSELQNEMHRQHERDLEIRYQHDLKEALRNQATDLENRRKHDLEAQAKQIVEDLQEELNHSVALIRKAQVDQLLTLHPQVDALQAQLKVFHEVAKETAAAVKQTVETHHVSSAVLALELALSSNHGQNAALFAKDLQKACKDDELVLSVLKALPENVLRDGALTHSELQVRFNIMRNEVRKVALAPEDAPKMVGQAIGTFLAWVTWVPKGHITGNGVEDALARADHHLERGRVREALAELDQVEGYSQVLMTDFKKLALDRLVVDQSIAVLKAKSILRHRAFV